MNSSYKVALAAAAAIFVVVVGYWAFSGDGAAEDDAPPAMAIDPGGLPDDDMPTTAPRDADSIRGEIESRAADTTPGTEADADPAAEPGVETAGATDADTAGSEKTGPRRDLSAVAGLITGDDTPDDGGPIEDEPAPGATAGANIGTDDEARLEAGSNTAVALGPPGELTIGGMGDGGEGESPAARRPVEPTPAVRPGAERRPDPEPVAREVEREPMRRVPAAAPGEPRVYVIEAGDTFSSIAEREFGDARHYVAIENENPTVNPNRLSVGQEVRLPAAADLRDFDRGEAPAEDRRVAAPAGGSVYVVKGGDSLRRIAREHYGSEEAWERIYKANRDLIGPDPAKIDMDMRLVLPPAE